MESKVWENGVPNPFHSLIDYKRINVLETNAVQCHDLPGAVAEVGVYHGGSLVRIAKNLRNKDIYGIDTFEGMPEPSNNDLHKKGDFADVDFEFMVAFFNVSFPKVRLIKGYFPSPDVLKKIEDDEFCLVHIDVDLYQSTVDCLFYFVPKLVLHGVLIVDDYGFQSTPGAKKAIDEYVMGLDTEKYKLNALTTGQYKIQRIK